MQIDKLNEYICGLNKPQHDAVVTTEGPVLVIAGAGSGKTRVLTMRIAYLLAQGVKPYNILALTFTNKAAREMKERIAGIVGRELSHQLWMGTFHSIFARILRIEASTLGITQDFTIYDAQDTKTLVSNIIKDLGLDDKKYKAKDVCSQISSAKNDLVLPDGFQCSAAQPRMAEVYRRYMDECHRSNALDFDDILLYTNNLISQNPPLLEKYQERFKYILVDEYQDTNRSQYAILNRLAQAHRNICVVGDDAQSIYSFRGARIENILSFQKDYPGSKLFKLEQNYRSTQNIVGLANKLIAKNECQIPKNVFSTGDVGDRVAVWPCQSDRTEAARVVGEISMRIRAEKMHPNDFAILYRTNSQSRVIEEEMRRSGLPYKIYGGLAFYQRKEVKDVLAYLRLTVNHNDTEALRRIINLPKRQIGQTSVDKAHAYSRAHDMTLWDVLSDPRHLGQIGVNGPTQQRITRFVGMIDLLAIQAANIDAYKLAVEMLTQSGLLQMLNDEKEDAEGKERFANVQELLNGIRDFVDDQEESGEPTDINAYLQQVSLITDMDDEDDAERVVMMTIHSSKGLEFDTVFVVGVEDEIFPAQQSTYDIASLQEERRLLYVAITRAKRTCVISYALSRYRNGRLENNRPSRFINDLDPRFCDKPDSDKSGSKSGSESGGGFGGFRFGGRGFQSGASSHSAPQPKTSGLNSFQRGTAVPGAGIVRTSAGASGGSVLRPLSVRPADQPEVELQQTPDGKYKVGMRIEHEKFGCGTIMLVVQMSEGEYKLKILFDTPRTERTLLLKFARIRVIG